MAFRQGLSLLKFPKLHSHCFPKSMNLLIPSLFNLNFQWNSQFLKSRSRSLEWSGRPRTHSGGQSRVVFCYSCGISRGCLPVAIEVTASIIEIQQKDPHFRENQSNGASDYFRVDQTSYVPLSKDMLAMLYCMAIIRLVNGVVEKT